MFTVLQSLAGFFVLTGLAWLMSENRSRVRWKVVVVGMVLQISLAVVFLKIPLIQEFFLILNQGVIALQEATKTGTSFVFGYLGGGGLPFVEDRPGSSFILAFQALPLVLVMSALSAVLYYWRILPMIVQGLSWLLQKSLGISGALGLGSAANIFMGMVEAPVLVRPFLDKMTRSELFALMTGGMATIAGTMMVLYAAILGSVIPDAMGHILAASIISAPAALMVALIMVPDNSGSSQRKVTMMSSENRSTMEAIVHGTTDGITLLINIIAMLIVLVALVALVNTFLGVLPAIDGELITLQRVFGWVMAPVAWLMGVPWAEAATAGALLGTKTVLNEFLAYLDLTKLSTDDLSERSRLIMTYALCGFANFGSLGIMVGGLTAMAPSRREEIVGLGMRTIVSGTLATCLTGAVVGILI
ncbi:MAG: nucleoside:proton symporter [Magnetococcales bacterium]|nr:nucleoside:proton symporter [Magnetococcales bacterium]